MSGEIPKHRIGSAAQTARHVHASGGATLLEKITMKVQSWIVNYFHNRIVGNYCTFPAPLTFGTIRIVPEILLPTNYNTVL